MKFNQKIKFCEHCGKVTKKKKEICSNCNLPYLDEKEKSFKIGDKINVGNQNE